MKEHQFRTVEFGIKGSVSEMFAQYFNACYPIGCSTIQHDEVKQAFYSGILSYTSFLLSDKMPKDADEAAEKMQSIFEECIRVLKARFN